MVINRNILVKIYMEPDYYNDNIVFILSYAALIAIKILIKPTKKEEPACRVHKVFNVPFKDVGIVVLNQFIPVRKFMVGIDFKGDSWGYNFHHSQYHETYFISFLRG